MREVVRQGLKFLTGAQNDDGGWGYSPEMPSAVEPTCAVLLALSTLSAGETARQRAVGWLWRAYHEDGSWGIAPDDPEGGWQTAWAVLALTRAGEPPEKLAASVEWLLSVKTLRFTDDELQRDIERILDIDPALRGWPWLPGQASWVEPTALTMLALAAGPFAPRAAGRLAEAVQYLNDRRCRAGGWNVGNPVMLGAPLPPRAHPTAWALMALNAVAPEAILPRDVAALKEEMHRDGGTSALALGLMALAHLGQDDGEARRRLVAAQRDDGSWEHNPYHTALALMGLRGGRL